MLQYMKVHKKPETLIGQKTVNGRGWAHAEHPG